MEFCDGSIQPIEKSCSNCEHFLSAQEIFSARGFCRSPMDPRWFGRLFGIKRRADVVVNAYNAACWCFKKKANTNQR